MTVRELQPHYPGIAHRTDALMAASARSGAPASMENDTSAEKRLERIVNQQYDFLWRTVRYAGVPDAFVEDAVQQVLCVLARRLGDVPPKAERSFLFATAMRVAADLRRTDRRRPSTPVDDLDAFAGVCPTPEELVDKRRAHEALQALVQTIPVDLRAVFVLFEIEEMTLVEISDLLGIPQGTVSSRLRRARERFQHLVRGRWPASGSRTTGGR